MVLSFPFNLSGDFTIAELLCVVSKTCECLGRKTASRSNKEGNHRAGSRVVGNTLQSKCSKAVLFSECGCQARGWVTEVYLDGSTNSRSTCEGRRSSRKQLRMLQGKQAGKIWVSSVLLVWAHGNTRVWAGTGTVNMAAQLSALSRSTVFNSWTDRIPVSGFDPNL